MGLLVGSIATIPTGLRPCRTNRQVATPFCQIISKAVACLVDKTLEYAATQERRLNTLRWTLKFLVQWCWECFQVRCCRETLRQTLKRLGYSWKKAKKLLNKANPARRWSTRYSHNHEGLFLPEYGHDVNSYSSTDYSLGRVPLSLRRHQRPEVYK